MSRGSPRESAMKTTHQTPLSLSGTVLITCERNDELGACAVGVPEPPHGDGPPSVGGREFWVELDVRLGILPPAVGASLVPKGPAFSNVGSIGFKV